MPILKGSMAGKFGCERSNRVREVAAEDKRENPFWSRRPRISSSPAAG
jgi:hypothetical protein